MAWDDKRMELAIGNMLRAGVLIAAAVVIVGGALYIYHAHGPHPDYTQFHGEANPFRTLPEILKLAVTGNSEAIIQIGLLLLIATPIARVVLAMIGFLLEKDRLYFAVSLTVLMVLLYSLFQGHGY